MGRSTLSAAIAAAVVTAVVVVACSSDDNNPLTLNRPDGGPICGYVDPTVAAVIHTSGGPCLASNTTCVNGNCQPNCSDGTNAACGAGKYCQGDAGVELVCAPNQAGACRTASDCPLPQFCFNGLCASTQRTASGSITDPCTLQEPGDACGPDALCLRIQDPNTQQTMARCVALTTCGQDRSCPVGAYGATCNDTADGGHVIPDKERICLVGYCETVADCPRDAGVQLECFYRGQDAGSGECQTGGPGDPCFTGSDCPVNNGGGCGGAQGSFDDGGTPGSCNCIDGGTYKLADGGRGC